MPYRNHTLTAVAALLLATTSIPSLAKTDEPTTWDGLVKVKAKRLDVVYLQPGADFRPYTKVMLDPTEVAFQKNWRRDYNRDRRDPSSWISESELQKTITESVAAANDIFTDAWTKGGYQVVTAPGPDVLRLRTGIVNISVAAPDTLTAGRSRSYADEAGEATLVLEVRDSETGALLGRALDRRIAGDTTMGWRSSVSNKSDFRRLVKSWADISVEGMGELKSHSAQNQVAPPPAMTSR